MSEDVLVFNSKNTAFNTVEKFYDSPISGSGTRVNAFTATNILTSSVDYTAYAVSYTHLTLPTKRIV